MSNRFTKNVLLTSTVLVGVAGFSSPAFAQAATEPVEAEPNLIESETTDTIVVTGSRISRPNLEQSSPVSVVDSEEISLVQPVSAEEFLRDLPSAVPSIGPAVNNGTNGSAQLNLRALGANRNLVLLNERRIVPATLGSVADLNVIPVAILERVDIFTGGASTVYGADAIAGVVNFITKRDFAGLDITANYGITERGDGRSYRADVTTGANFDDGRGNAVLNVGYARTAAILQGARAIGLESRSSTCAANQLPPVVGAEVCPNLQIGNPQGSPTSAPASILFPLVGNFNPATGTIDAGLGNFNFNPLNVFQTPFERWNIYGQARYEISPAVEAFTEAFYTRTEVDQRIAPSGTFFTTLQVPLNNQFLTPAQRLQLCQAAVGIPGGLPAGTNCATAIAAGTPINTQIGRRFVEAGPRRTNYRTHTYQVVAGLQGPLTANLNWEISGQYGRSDRRNTSTGQGTKTRLQAALNGCPAGSPTGCVPINIFGAPGTLSQASFDFLNVATYNFINTELGAAQAIVSGDLGFASPLANEAIGIALGAEYRRYEGSSGGDAISATSGEVLGAGAPALPVTGEYNTKELFAELVVPLIEDRPFFENLTLEAGVRYSDYSTSGGNWTYKVGGSWMPIQDIKFRGVYSVAVRAPNIGELFQPTVVFLTNRPVDPCQGTEAQVATRGAENNSPNLVAICKATTPAGTFGNIQPPAAGQINATTGGNPNLDPETAKTLTAGVVLQPRFLPGTAFTVDYFDIRVEDAITTPSQADIIDACYFGNANPQSAQCQAITRNPLTGGLSGPNDTTPGPFLGLSNLGTIETSGVDIGASFRRQFGFGRLSINGNATWTEKFLFQATPTSINRQCTGFYSTPCDPPQPEWVWNVRTTLGIGKSDISLLWRHLNSVRAEPPAPSPQLPVGTPTNSGTANVVGAYRRIPAYDYFDLAFQQEISEEMRLTITVQNLFDKDPPDVGNTIGSTTFNSGNTYPTIYDAAGRRFVAGVNLRF